MQNTMTTEQALQRAEEYVRQAVAVLPSQARLEVLSTPGPHSCDDPTDNGPKGRVFASNSYWIRDLSKEKNQEYLERLLQWWAEHGFTGNRESWDKAKFVTFENKDDREQGRRFPDGLPGRRQRRHLDRSVLPLRVAQRHSRTLVSSHS
jgi:hypothetical protein